MDTISPATRDADLALAIQLHAAGRLDAAERIYQRLYAVDRRDTEVIYLMGVLCCDLGLFEEARRFLEEALTIVPLFPEARAQLPVALNGLAGMALTRGDAAAAEGPLMASLAARGDQAETLNWLGLARLQMGKHAAAETPLRQALQLQPELNQTRNNLGLTLHHQGRLGEAQACFEEALARDPAYQNARINLANTLRILGQHARARRELETVLTARPDAVDALNNLGAVLQDLGQAELALASLTQALVLAPSSAQIRWNLALTQLQLGDFQNGWSNFESRWEGCENLRGGYQMPVEHAWRGESLEGKRLLLWAEQGFGDTLQFIRFAQDAALQGAAVSVVAQPELADLVQGVPGVGAVSAQGAPLPAYDFHCPLMSLPYRLGVSPNAVGLRGTTPYLHAAKDRIEHWRQRLTAHPGLKVGLVWAGSSRRQSAELAAIDARRSIPLQGLAPILAVRGCSFFSLQKGAAWGTPSGGTSAELGHGTGAGPAPVHDFSAEWSDFSGTAAFVANLDLVISVDTAVAHLAGALGKPVWLLNRYDTCWRWLLGRNDSPWYSTLRQFRQPRRGDWESPIAAAAVALAEAPRSPMSRKPPRADTAALKR